MFLHWMDLRYFGMPTQGRNMTCRMLTVLWRVSDVSLITKMYAPRSLFLVLQSSQVKCSPIESIDELVMWKMNPLDVGQLVWNSNLHSWCIGDEQWIRFLPHLLSFPSGWKNLWIDKIVIKTFMSILKKLSWQKSHNNLVCEFTAHYACRNKKRWNWNLPLITNSTFKYPFH